ncbi:DUF6053 domain-containing protein [Lysobacter enzymogenes]
MGGPSGPMPLDQVAALPRKQQHRA